MFVLWLNDMRSPQIEIRQPVARADSAEQLEALMAREKVEHYRDGQWGKSFRQGGPLEWYNEPFEGFGQGIVATLTEQEFIARQLEEYREFMTSIPDAGTL